MPTDRGAWVYRARLALWVVDCEACGEFVRNIEAPNTTYVQCSVCFSWQHEACVGGAGASTAGDASYACRSCVDGFRVDSTAALPPGHGLQLASADLVADSLVLERVLRSCAARLDGRSRSSRAMAGATTGCFTR